MTGLVTAVLAALLAAAGQPGHHPAGQAGPAQLRARSAVDVCRIDDPRAVELSGLVATGTGYLTINDSQNDASKVRIISLDADCRVTRTTAYPTPARDPEDVAIAPDGTVWVADIGDNSLTRSTIALWHLPSGGGSPVINRLTYPDGPHDAEALLFRADGSPVVVTKELGVGVLYGPTQPLAPRTTAGVPMVRLGEFRPKGAPTDVLTGAGNLLVTGAATSPDRRRVALRTYTTAYEWQVSDGDVVRAITTGTPALTALTDEPQGEAIAYSADGSAFLTVSDQTGPTMLRRYLPAALPTSSPVAAGPAAATVAWLTALPRWYAVAAAGGLGLAVVGLAHRRRRRDRYLPRHRFR